MFGFFKKGLQKTAEAMKSVAPAKRKKIPKEELEDILLEADVEYDLIEIILRELYEDEVTRDQLESKLLATLAWANYERPDHVKPFVDLVIGINGAGKTTTIAKLTQRFQSEGERVLLGAADTFRAAAIEQLTRWADRLNVPIVSSRQGHDPSAVAYDAIESAKSRGYERVIIDTAGRLHTQSNLAEELKKIVRICGKAHEGAPHRKILIIDGTQGNSAIAQAKAFNDMVSVDGIIITKLDGTAKGGSLFSIAYALRLPIFFVGVGEKPEDLVPFDKYQFVSDFLDPLFEVDENAAKSGVDFRALDDTRRQALSKKMHADGFEALSKHFIRETATLKEYRQQPNETGTAMEIVDKAGTIIKMYTLKDLEA